MNNPNDASRFSHPRAEYASALNKFKLPFDQPEDVTYNATMIMLHSLAVDDIAIDTIEHVSLTLEPKYGKDVTHSICIPFWLIIAVSERKQFVNSKGRPASLFIIPEALLVAYEYGLPVSPIGDNGRWPKQWICCIKSKPETSRQDSDAIMYFKSISMNLNFLRGRFIFDEPGSRSINKIADKRFIPIKSYYSTKITANDSSYTFIGDRSKAQFNGLFLQTSRPFTGTLELICHGCQMIEIYDSADIAAKTELIYENALTRAHFTAMKESMPLPNDVLKLIWRHITKYPATYVYWIPVATAPWYQTNNIYNESHDHTKYRGLDLCVDNPHPVDVCFAYTREYGIVGSLLCERDKMIF